MIMNIEFFLCFRNLNGIGNNILGVFRRNDDDEDRVYEKLE